MELKGKKINFLGDSITQGVGVDSPEKIYLNLLKESCGLSEARNYGISGSRIARQSNYETENLPAFCDRFKDMDDNADVVVVFGGTNDYGHGDAPLGSFDSRDVNTFYGAMHILCEKLMNKYPTAQLVFMTPLHRLGEERLINERGIRNVATLSGYVDIIKEVTRYYSIPTLDLYSVSGMQPQVEVLKQTYMPDGLHPNDAGAEKIAKLLYGFLKSL